LPDLIKGSKMTTYKFLFTKGEFSFYKAYQNNDVFYNCCKSELTPSFTGGYFILSSLLKLKGF